MSEPWSTTTETASGDAHAPSTSNGSAPVDAPAPAGGAPAPDRRLTRRRTLPGGRAVLGALLVTLAVIGVVVTHLSVTAAPGDRYLVAAADLPAGTLLIDTAAIETNFRQVALDLPAELAAGAVHVDTAAQLVGRRLLAALTEGDLLQASGLAAAGTDPGTSTFSFSLPLDAAVGGSLSVGDHIDVVATTGSGTGATTAYVVRAAPLIDLASTGGTIGGDAVRLTVELDEPQDVQALAHALATATVVVVRSPDDSTPAPPPYRPTGGAPAEAEMETPAPTGERSAEQTDTADAADPPDAADTPAAGPADDAEDGS